MKITNKYNIPEPLVKAIQSDNYDKGDADFSVTQLIRPAYQSRLMSDNWNKIEEDVSDGLWKLMGTSIHVILEKAANPEKYDVERRLFSRRGGYKISGQVDLYESDSGSIWDYKVTSVWSVVNGPKDEWIQQANIYAWMTHDNGGNVGSLQVCAMLRDWSPKRAKKERNYPQNAVAVVEIPLWNKPDTETYLDERIRLHANSVRAATVTDIEPCTAAERWSRPDRWAAMEKGKKRAKKLHDSEDLAQEHASNLKGGYVEFRPGANVRCEEYCSVSGFCPFFRELKKRA